MPRQRRQYVAVRVGDAGLAAVDDRAAKRGMNRSEMIRLMLAYAARNMPEGWKP